MDEPTESVQQLAQRALNTIDALLSSIEGGEGLRPLIDARGVLSGFVHRQRPPHDAPLTTLMPPVGGVTLVRSGQHFTITDEELEQVRDAVNTRKRELRKQARRADQSCQKG